MRARHGLLPLLFLPLSGCTVVGTVLHVAFGPPAVDAKYEPKKRPTLVLVEDYQNQDASDVDGDIVARQVGETLHKQADLEVIDPDKVAPLRTEHPADFRAMKIPAIGQAVGAEQVLYVNLTENQTAADPTGAAVHASATARVRVVDVKTGEVLWPAGEINGHLLTAKMDYDRSDSSKGQGMRTEMLTQLSTEISHLFYSWKPESEKESGE